MRSRTIEPPMTTLPTQHPSAGTVLHVGCGLSGRDSLPRALRSEDWRLVRYDIDPGVRPDIVGSILEMSAVEPASVDVLFSAHVIEHLFAHEVPVALAEFHRVLRSDGFAVISCPDMQAIAELVARGQMTEAAYTSPAGPIAPIDMIWGHRDFLAKGNHFMAHRCGFTSASMLEALRQAGFARGAAFRVPHFNLVTLATKQAVSDQELGRLCETYLPP
jgi:hypothetical protein